jgi:hypothetical protein
MDLEEIMRKHSLVMIVAVILVAVTGAFGSVPDYINFQGTLTDSAGNPFNGETSMTFSFFNLPETGTPLWSETHSAVEITNGIFQVFLGTINPFPDTLLNDPGLWLEISVGAEVLTPRTQIASVPFGMKCGSADFAFESLFTGHAEHATYADTAEFSFIGAPDADWIIDSENIYHVDGTVGIGTPEPQFKLDLVGDRIRLQDSAHTKQISLRVDGPQAGVLVDNANLILRSTTGNTIMQPVEGNVGIGTTSPDAPLHVSSAFSTWGMLKIARSDSGDHEASIAFIEGSDAATDEYWLVGAGVWNQTNEFVIGRSQPNMVITPDPYVGIGVWNPISKLHIKGYEPTYLTVEASTGHSPGLTLNSGGTNQWTILYHPSDTFLSFYKEGSGDKMVIKNNGYVGIGTTSPQRLLHIYGTNNPRLLIGAPAEATPELNLQRGTNTYAIYMNSSNDLAFYNAGTHIVFTDDGNVGVGTTSPDERMHVIGTVKCTELKITGGSDIAEPFNVKQTDTIEPGMVMSIDPENPGKLKTAETAYDHCVAGIISGAGGIQPGMLMSQSRSTADGEYPIAMTGRVYCKADASNGPIKPGDLLTSSETPGHAMKVTDYSKAHGATIGKAMTCLEQGTGLVLVLVALQ